MDDDPRSWWPCVIVIALMLIATSMALRQCPTVDQSRCRESGRHVVHDVGNPKLWTCAR